MADSSLSRLCFNCRVANGPQHVFCRKCGTYLGISRVHEVEEQRELTPKEAEDLRNSSITGYMTVVLYLVFIPALLSFNVVFFSFIAGSFDGISIFLLIFLVFGPLAWGLFNYAQWARLAVIAVFAIITLLFFYFDYTFLSYLFAFFTIFCFHSLYNHPGTVELFERDWQLDFGSPNQYR